MAAGGRNGLEADRRQGARPRRPGRAWARRRGGRPAEMAAFKRALRGLPRGRARRDLAAAPRAARWSAARSRCGFARQRRRGGSWPRPAHRCSRRPGAFRLTRRGRRLAAGSRRTWRGFALADGGAAAAAGSRRAGRIGPVEERATSTRPARCRIADGVVSFPASAASPVKAARLELGANDIEAIAGGYVPTRRAAVRHRRRRAGGCRAGPRASPAVAPFLQARVERRRGRGWTRARTEQDG